MANKIKVEICLGTTCYVLGSFRLSALEEQLPPEFKDRVEVVGCACLDVCHDRNYGNAPFVRIDEKAHRRQCDDRKGHRHSSRRVFRGRC